MEEIKKTHPEDQLIVKRKGDTLRFIDKQHRERQWYLLLPVIWRLLYSKSGYAFAPKHNPLKRGAQVGNKNAVRQRV